jgi:hypothetical protein
MSSIIKSTRKNKINEKNITLFFLEILNNIKLFHWNTPAYSAHKASDQLYEKLNDIFDMFIEILLRDKRLHTFKVKIPTDNLGSKDLIKKLKKFEKWFMEQDLTPELCNLRDEGIAHIRQFYYLMKLK